jgi:hypothetical protein
MKSIPINFLKTKKMKKIFFSLMLLAGLGLSTSSFAGKHSPDVSKKVWQSFHERFSSALDISWEQERDLEKATFRIDGMVVFAYFNSEGEWIATSRNILSSQLPIPLLLKLKREYGEYWITGLVEMDTPSGMDYYITLENSNRSLLLKSSDFDQWTLFQKLRKD